MSGFKYMQRECDRCRRSIGIEEAHCPHCGDDGTFRFPVVHALGVAVFVAGAVAYHHFPEFGAALLRLSGNGAIVPD